MAQIEVQWTLKITAIVTGNKPLPTATRVKQQIRKALRPYKVQTEALQTRRVPHG